MRGAGALRLAVRLSPAQGPLGGRALARNLAAPDTARLFAAALVGLTGSGENPLDGFLILFRSASSPAAARIAREQIARIHHASAADAIRGTLFLSLVAGVQMMRQMIGLKALTEADPDLLVELIEPLFRRLIADG